MFSTICYYVEEFVQAFGRDYRQPTTKGDVYNYAVFFEDTLVANHTAPKLAKKLASVNSWAATGVDLERDLVDAVVRGKVSRQLELSKDLVETLVEAEGIDDTLLDEDGEEEND
jgi:hypothetical protein